MINYEYTSIMTCFIHRIIPLLILLLFSGGILTGGEAVVQKEKAWLVVFPVAGIPGTDLRRILSYFDHDPKKATEFDEYGMGRNNLLDYMGGTRTYDGHQGTDISITTFEWQDIGIPIVAAADGVVKEIQDGNSDRYTDYIDRPGNSVLIDHGNNRQTYYNHLRRGSITVQKGEKVKAGQQIGLLGSSGRSTWPHLHFGCHEGGKWIDPFSLPVNASESRWKEQPGYEYPMTVVDWGLSYAEKSVGAPVTPNRESFVQRGKSKNENLQLWVEVLNILPEKHNRIWRIISSNGKYTNDFEQVIDGSKKWHGPGSAQHRYTYNMSFSEKSTAGNWVLEFFCNQSLLKRFHFTVADAEPPNRSPAVPAGVKISPAMPHSGEPVVCIVAQATDTLDPDLDKESYSFEWLVNGKVLRSTINATRCDYLPAGALRGGETLICRVRTHDGLLFSGPVEVSATCR